jgi:hypothetical protein
MAIEGSCHCGATKFTVAKRPDTVTRCICIFCTKRRALVGLSRQRQRFHPYQGARLSLE